MVFLYQFCKICVLFSFLSLNSYESLFVLVTNVTCWKTAGQTRKEKPLYHVIFCYCIPHKHSQL